MYIILTFIYAHSQILVISQIKKALFIDIFLFLWKKNISISFYFSSYYG